MQSDERGEEVSRDGPFMNFGYEEQCGYRTRKSLF